MPLLYYWRPDNYRRDLDMGAGYHLNQSNPLLHEIELGDSLWAFTRRNDGGYVIAVELVVCAKTINPTGFRYGTYRIWGNLDSSRYFRVKGQPNIENIIRRLSCKTNAKILAQAFQGHAAVRKISLEDHNLLILAASDLPLEPRAKLLPEDRLEAELLMGNKTDIQKFLREENPGIAKKRFEYLFQLAPSRNRKNVSKLQNLYQGKCQICEWAPKKKYGAFLCQAHHLQWLSRGGSDSISNLVLICPNHHIALHRCDVPLDFKDLAFTFSAHKETLRLNYHLKKIL